MSLILTDSQHYSDIASAIRTKKNTLDTYTPAQMATAISSIVPGVVHNWMGDNPTYIKKVYSLSTTLNQTNYPSWTPSTTATKMIDTTTVSTTESLDLENYEYILVWLSDCNVAYDNTWTASKATCLRECCLFTQSIFRRPASVESATSELYDYNVGQENTKSIYYCKYYSTASAISLANTTYSPCYIYGITAPTFSSTSSLTPTLTIKTPTMYARCSTTYFSTTNAAKVDQSNTTIKMEGHLYRVDVGTSTAHGTWVKMVDLFNNPL